MKKDTMLKMIGCALMFFGATSLSETIIINNGNLVILAISSILIGLVLIFNDKL